MTPATSRSWATRLIHLLLLSAILCQLATSQFMRKPFPGDPASTTFDLHQYVGLASTVIVFAFWIWTAIRRGEIGFGRLMPWLSASRRKAVFADAAVQLRLLARLHAPSDEDGALASAVHGLGLLVATAMAVTGTLYFVAPHAAFGRSAMSLHKLSANLMWGYLFAHAGIAVVHHMLGSDIFSRMFWSRQRWPRARV